MLHIGSRVHFHAYKTRSWWKIGCRSHVRDDSSLGKASDDSSLFAGSKQMFEAVFALGVLGVRQRFKAGAV